MDFTTTRILIAAFQTGAPAPCQKVPVLCLISAWRWQCLCSGSAMPLNIHASGSAAGLWGLLTSLLRTSPRSPPDSHSTFHSKITLTTEHSNLEDFFWKQARVRAQVHRILFVIRGFFCLFVWTVSGEKRDDETQKAERSQWMREARQRGPLKWALFFTVITWLEKEAEDFASGMFSSGLFVVHDASWSCQHNEPAERNDGSVRENRQTICPHEYTNAQTTRQPKSISKSRVRLTNIWQQVNVIVQPNG